MVRRSLLACAVAVLALLATASPAAAADPVRVEQQRIEGAGVALDTSLYLPAVTPAPAVLVAHGFGGTKASVDADARDLAARGYVVLTWTARGFGASGGQIALDAPDAEVADARKLVDWLAQRPEVRQDGPGDPRVGVTGGSYGGALSLMLAGYDKRIDAIAPVITWNDLGQALFPNTATRDALPADTPARGAFAPDGVFKRGWAGVFFASGRTAQPAPGTVLTCGRFVPVVCAAYTEAATTGRISPTTAALLARSSPASITDKITAPTLLVQGEQDTLFGLDQADANARQIAAHGTPVKVTWYAGGHDGGAPDQAVRDQIGAWFDHWLAGRGSAPDLTFTYAVQSGVRAGPNTPTSRTVVAPTYPGLAGDPTPRQDLPLSGDPQVVLAPAGASPAAITSLPGLGGALGAVAGRLTAISGAIPGQTVQFATAPVATPLTVTGAPRVQLTVSRVPGQPAPAEAVLFVGTSEVAQDGTRTLLGSSVAPLRVAVPADGSPVGFTVTLPGVVAPVEAGHTLVVTVATTDQGYAGGTEPAVWRVGVTGALSVPLVAGEARSANTVPPVPAIGIGVILLGALVAGLVARLRRRPAAAPPDPAAPPLRVTDVAKTYKGGFSAVKGVSFTVERGTVLGLLGPNGAGKTTVLRMLMGLIRPTGGTITAFGEEVRPGAPVLARIGAFVEGPGFLPHLSGRENLALYWSATGLPTEESHVDEMLQIAGLGASIDRRVGTYSQGMRQRLAIAQAMLGRPDLLVLDEPTNGLDPPQIHAMRDVLRRYAADGRTVLVSSHLLAEVEQTCSHVVVMHHGKVVAAGTVEQIIAGGGAATFGVDAPDHAAAVLGELAGVHGVRVDGGAVHAELNGTPRAEAVRALVAAGVNVTSAGPRRRLEDAFLQLVGEDLEP
ncbi:MAG: alpha/beta fold hydrolase [Pseudonocardia sp.]|nr:alpha/beta fold hydrolase [Pseudonocardia sp.]